MVHMNQIKRYCFANTLSSGCEREWRRATCLLEYKEDGEGKREETKDRDGSLANEEQFETSSEGDVTDSEEVDTGQELIELNGGQNQLPVESNSRKGRKRGSKNNVCQKPKEQMTKSGRKSIPLERLEYFSTLSKAGRMWTCHVT
ncbi:hypothetical protein BpHYR1_048584 [Brachionus plicatilis]|uniref:Uncharacterized protein n=1 Tax=Brachionus plicatilis TaxID=10195 RepID=A0A3M7S342_BRAPC|nr:hypothetical protein BpHYR1_048584 [Brachionus plicatilis]